MKTIRKYLHIELKPNGFYVYADNRKQSSSQELTLEDMDEECCMSDGLTLDDSNLCLIKGKLHLRIDLEKLVI